MIVTGIGWNEYDDDIPQLVYRKYHLKEQTMFNDVALLGEPFLLYVQVISYTMGGHGSQKLYSGVDSYVVPKNYFKQSIHDQH